MLIRPSDINTKNHFWGAFGDAETETSAMWLVRFCAQREGDDWRPFPLDDLTAFYQKGRLEIVNQERRKMGRAPQAPFCETFRFNNLKSTVFGGPFVTIDDDKRVHVTPKFVMSCFAVAGFAQFPGIGD